MKAGASFEDEGGTASGHVAIWGFRFFKSTLMDAIIGTSLLPLLGMAFVSSAVNADLNCWFNVLTLARASLCMNPSVFLRGATPVASWPLLLTYVQNVFEFSL